MDSCKAAGLKTPQWTTTETSVKLSFPLNVKLGGATDGAFGGGMDDYLTSNIDGAIDGATDGATKATKHKLSDLLKAIVENEGNVLLIIKLSPTLVAKEQWKGILSS